MVYTNAKNHITISISRHSYRVAFNKHAVLNALSKLMDTATWLRNQCFLQSALVEFGAVIYNDFGAVSPNWRKWLEELICFRVRADCSHRRKQYPRVVFQVQFHLVHNK